MAAATFQQEEWITALREHEREVETLSRTLQQLDVVRTDANPAGWIGENVRLQVETITARLMRHRIAMALLESRLQTIPGDRPRPGPPATPTRWWREAWKRYRR